MYDFNSTEPDTDSSFAGSGPRDGQSTTSSSEDGECNLQCCQETLDVFQVKQKTFLTVLFRLVQELPLVGFMRN